MKRPVPEVTKRDGRRERFDPGKIVRSVHRAATAAGVEDELLCEELAAAATMVLEQRFPGQTPTTGALREVVEAVLMETGHAEVARQFILYPRAHAVAGERREDDGAVTVRVPGQDRPRAFRRHDLVDALVLEPGVGPEQAEELARQVEALLALLPWSPLDASLVDELVAATLHEQGFVEAWRQRQRLALTRGRVESLVARARDEGRSGEGRVGRAILAQHAVDRVLPDALAHAHQSGELEVDGLGCPGRALAATVSFADVTPARSERLVPGLARLAREMDEVLYGPLTLGRPERLVALGLAEEPALRAVARELLLALVPARSSGAEDGGGTVLALGGGFDAEEMATLFRAGHAPEQVAARAERFVQLILEEAAGLGADLALPALTLLPAPTSGRPFAAGPAAPGLERAGLLTRPATGVEIWPLRVIGARVGVNVARLALRAGRRRERALLRAVREATQSAVAAGACRLRGLMALDDTGSGPFARLRRVLEQGNRALPLDLPGRHPYHCHLVAVGLGAAVQAMTEQEVHESERARELCDLVLAEMRAAVPTGTPGGTTFEVRVERFGRAERRFGRRDFEAFPRGRDILRLSHDGDAYRYGWPRPGARQASGAAAGGRRSAARAARREAAPSGRNPAP